MNLVFAGTPAFTLPCLSAIANSSHQLQAVYTQPDRPAGRGRQLQASAVKLWAQAHDIPVYQPVNFKDPTTIAELEQLSPDVMIVIAYGLILPSTVLQIPRFGCINVHASLLPRWRGAAPIQYAILQGDHETGITIMQMDAGMDTGPMLMQTACPITTHDTTQTLQDKLAAQAPEPLLQTLALLTNNQIQPILQNESQATYATKINKEMARICWQKPATEIDRLIRAFIPWPIAFTSINDHILRIHQAHVVQPQRVDAPPGAILHLDKHGIHVNTGQGVLCIERIQLPGAKVISIADWLNSKQQTFAVSMVFQ